MSEVSFDISVADAMRITKIIRRVAAMDDSPLDQLSLRLDLTATHANGCPLDFKRMLEADDFNLIHDVFGIENHIDRATGKLLNHFRPRFAKKLAVRMEDA